MVDRGEVQRLLTLRDKRQFSDLSEEIWPARTKTDLSLRRTRLLDWVILFRREKREKDLYEILWTSKKGWDLIFVTNLCAATLIFGQDWYSRWLWLGAFEGDLSHFIAVAKRVHDLGKTRGIEDANWINFVECAGLSGYRNPPFPGFDVEVEAAALAGGGEEHNLYGHTWDALCCEFLPMDYHYVKFVPFDEWVKQADWLTSGASSVGRLEVEGPDKKVIRIKARKNMVADVVDLGVLAEDAVNFRGQMNTVIIKSELGKLRLAVASDMYNYLKMSWVNGLLGGAYYDWPGNTSEEDFKTQTARMFKMLSLCAKKYGLPYDYAGFDHQPTTAEILGIVKVLCRHARINVPYEYHAQFDDIVQSIVEGFNSATLSVKLDGLDKVFPVTGGLMSGLRWTSVVGNAWNSVMTGLAMKLLESWGIPTDQIQRYIRGDDSAIFVDSWAEGVAMNIAYDAIGAKAGVGKFSLQYHKMEFLRVWFENRCHGYPARAIPGLTQRKPWSSNPWSEDMVLKALYDGIRTLKRRVTGRDKELDSIWAGLRHIWCVNHNLPDAVCWTPTHSGGFGIEASKPGEHWVIEPPVPKADTSGGCVPLNQTNWRRDKLTGYALDRYGVDIGELAQTLAVDELMGTITADNVPALAKIVREDWLFRVRKARCRAKVTKTVLAPVVIPVDISAYNGGNVEVLLQRLGAEAPLFGSCPEIETARIDYAKFRFKGGFKKWLMHHYPRASAGLQQFHKSWHISEAIDYLAGRVNIAPKVLHPALVGVLSKYVACCLKPRHRAIRCASLWLGSVLEPYVANSDLSQTIYWW